VRSAAERRDEVAAIGTRRLRAVFEGLLDAPVAIGAAGRVRDAARARLQALAEGLGEA
jgi:hypothetical protein